MYTCRLHNVYSHACIVAHMYIKNSCFYNMYTCTSTHSLQLEIAVSSVGIGDSLVRAGVNTHCVAVEGIHKLSLDHYTSRYCHMTIT